MPPILSHKHYSAASAFKPENLLREARRQKSLPDAPYVSREGGQEQEYGNVTNQMGRIEGDFEKGIADGAEESLKVIVLSAANWRAKRDDHESL